MPPTTIQETDDDIVIPNGPTFKIFSGTLKTFEKDGDGRKYLSCTASSTVDDLHGDHMTQECVQGMAPQAKSKGMTIFLNHSYKVPEDVFGKTVDSKIVSRGSNADGSPIYDLDLEIMLNESNPRAVETYAGIKDQGMKMGVSIGAMIEDYAFIDEEAGFWGGLEIKAVNLLEASIVGIPANQRSWVINALNSLGAPKEYIAKALGKTYDESLDPRKAVTVKEATPVLGELHEVTHTYTLDGVDVTDKIKVNTTDTILKLDAEGNPITDDAETASEEETPVEASGADELDPADEEKTLSLEDAETALASMKSAGADSSLAEIVLGFLEGATEEVASLRKTNLELTQANVELTDQVKDAVEIVETLARTPIGRKAQFTGPVTSFRKQFGGFYDKEFLKLLDSGDDTNE